MTSKKPTIAIPLANEPELLSKRLMDLSSETNWDLPVRRGQALAGRELQQWLLDREERALKSCVERGVGYTVLKNELGHGAFTAWLNENGLSDRTVQKDMKTARMLIQLSAPNAKRASQLPQRKLEVLAGLPAPVVDDLFDEGTLDNAEAMSRDELGEIVKLRKEYANLKQKNETLAMQLDKAREESSGKSGEWPMPVRRAREEGVVHGAHAVAIADELLKEMHAFDEALSVGGVDEAGKRAAYGAIYYAALQAAHRFNQICQEILPYYDVTGGEDLQPLSPQEVRRVDETVKFLVSSLRNAGDARENTRRNAAPGRKGRKRKV